VESQVLKAVTMTVDDVQSSETSVNFNETTRHYTPEDNNLYIVFNSRDFCSKFLIFTSMIFEMNL
jgi:hypothetical protein